MEEQQDKQALTCPECGWIAKNRAGLSGHRQFKHGVRPTAQLPLEPLDRLVTESRLEERLSDLELELGSTDEIKAQRESYSAELRRLTGTVLERLDQLEKRAKQLGSQVERITEELPSIRGDILALKGGLEIVRAGKK